MITISAIVPAFARLSAPSIVARNGYINGTPLTTHTTTSFNSTGASTLVAFVSTNAHWNSLSESINGVNDSAGNTWTARVGLTLYGGTGSIPLLSGIYYVNAPKTSTTHTVTATQQSGAAGRGRSRQHWRTKPNISGSYNGRRLPG